VKWIAKRGEFDESQLPEDWMEYVSWSWPKLDELDEGAHQEAIRKALLNGTKTYKEILGNDWREKLLQTKEEVAFFKEQPAYGTDLYTHKKMKTNDEIALASLQAALPVLEGIEDWNTTVIHDTLMALIVEMGIKNGQMLWPVRTALSGEPTSPGGAMELADILGKEESIRRIKAGIELLSK
jgi:glutamyl-tRNA synthetase